MTDQDAEDILSESLVFLGGRPVIDDSIVQYGPLVLSLPAKEGKANTLLADHLFSPALFLAERIERGLLDVSGKAVIELGAGSALPSLLLSTRPNPPPLVVVTDYPDDGIIGNLRKNVERNSSLVAEGCTVKYEGYEWGGNPDTLLDLVHRPVPGYDVVILSDLLHFFDSHDSLIASTTMLLGKQKEARVYVGAGKYTRPEICDNFLAKSKSAGLEFEEIFDDAEGKWLGTLAVSSLDHEALALRKSNCRFWVGHWPTPAQYMEMSGEESGSSADESPTQVRRWLPEADAETRRAYGTALMGVQDMDIDYDPALFEDAYLIDDTVELYSDNTSIENWSRGVTGGV